jgi:mRNA interferase RelE/StbE
LTLSAGQQPWRIEPDPRFRKDLRALDRQVAARVVKLVYELAALDAPEARCKPLQHRLSGLYRARLGSVRVIIDIDRPAHALRPLRAGNRDAIYAQLMD